MAQKSLTKTKLQLYENEYITSNKGNELVILCQADRVRERPPHASDTFKNALNTGYDKYENFKPMWRAREKKLYPTEKYK
jgi:hypothetical protein